MGVTILHGRRPPLSIQFTVLGRPQPAGSKKGFVHPSTGRVVIVDDAKQSRPWKQQVSGEAQHAVSMHPGWRVGDDRPMRLELLFVLSRPKGHFGSGRNAGVVRRSAPPWPTVKPDATKLLRAVEDALSGIVWHDDTQVVEQAVRKVYGVPERVEVLVSVLEPEPGQLELAA